jgi:hypothetical protein
MTQVDLSPFMFNYIELCGNTLRGGFEDDGKMATWNTNILLLMVRAYPV